MKYTLGPYEFASKAEAKALFKDFLDKYRGDIPVDSEAHKALLEIIANHPDRVQKIGSGVKSFFVALDSRFHRNHCFNLMREDGTHTEFSPMKVIDGQPSYRSKFMAAARRSVSPDITAFKSRYFRDRIYPTCPVLHTLLTVRNSHVDHEAPHTFARICDLFLKLQTLEAQFCPAIDGDCGYIFESKDFSDQFRRYHFNYVTRHNSLRVISAKANLEA